MRALLRPTLRDAPASRDPNNRGPDTAQPGTGPGTPDNLHPRSSNGCIPVGPIHPMPNALSPAACSGATHICTRPIRPMPGLWGRSWARKRRFASRAGNEVTSTSGQRAKLVRPLDFLVVSDHAGFYGVAPALKRGDEARLALSGGQGREWSTEWRGACQSGSQAMKVFKRHGSHPPDWPIVYPIHLAHTGFDDLGGDRVGAEGLAGSGKAANGVDTIYPPGGQRDS